MHVIMQMHTQIWYHENYKIMHKAALFWDTVYMIYLIATVLDLQFIQIENHYLLLPNKMYVG